MKRSLCLIMLSVTCAACGPTVEEKEGLISSSSSSAVSVSSSTSSAPAVSSAKQPATRSWSVYHHTEPTFSFSYPAGWTVSDDEGDMDIYIGPNDESFDRIILTYCGKGCTQCFDGELKEVPGLGTTGCYFKSPPDSPTEQWSVIDVPVGDGMLTLSAETYMSRMPALLKILATIRRSVSVQP